MGMPLNIIQLGPNARPDLSVEDTENIFTCVPWQSENVCSGVPTGHESTNVNVGPGAQPRERWNAAHSGATILA